jgi:hypothetical protein
MSVAADGPARFDEDAEAQVLSALNHSRAEAGVPELKLDPALRDAARKHSILLAQRNVLSHQFAGEASLSDRLRAAGLFFTAASENVGINSSLDDVNAMFMRSPGHRVNMLNPGYSAVGIGVVHRGRDYWVTEDFATLTPSLSAQQAEDEAAQGFELEWKKTRVAVPKRLTIDTLRTFACQIAKSGGKLQKTTITSEGKSAHAVIGYSTPDPSSLASQADSVISNTSLSAYAVGACTPQQSGDGGQFWIVMAFF